MKLNPLKSEWIVYLHASRIGYVGYSVIMIDGNKQPIYATNKSFNGIVREIREFEMENFRSGIDL